jgi:hypothetical protein
MVTPVDGTHTTQKRKRISRKERGGGGAIEKEGESRILLTRNVMQQGPAIKAQVTKL